MDWRRRAFPGAFAGPRPAAGTEIVVIENLAAAFRQQSRSESMYSSDNS
jgi:hypothetical protein